MKADEFKKMMVKIHMYVNILKRDIHIHCDKHGSIVTFDFFDDDGNQDKSYEYIN